MRFLGTKVLLYSVPKAPEEREKAEIVRDLLRQRDLALSVQVLQECYFQVTRESRPTPCATTKLSGWSNRSAATPFRT